MNMAIALHVLVHYKTYPPERSTYLYLAGDFSVLYRNTRTRTQPCL